MELSPLRTQQFTWQLLSRGTPCRALAGDPRPIELTIRAANQSVPAASAKPTERLPLAVWSGQESSPSLDITGISHLADGDHAE